MIKSFRSLWHAFWVLALMAAVAGCDQGPALQKLTGDLTQRLDENYTPGLFDVASVATAEPPPATRLDLVRRTVPFTITLKLKRDHDFSAWDQANAYTLVRLLGGGSDSASGIKPSGNKAGDLIRVTGIAVYVRDHGEWRLDTSAPPAPTLAVDAPTRATALRQLVRLVLTTARVLVIPSRAPDVLDELTATTARLARLDSGFAVASGPVGGDYWLLAEAARIQERGSVTPVVNVATRDTLESLSLLRDGRITAAIMQNNEAAMAANGTGPFERIGTFPDLRAAASLFPKPAHVLVMAASNIASVNDLYGKRIAVAATGPAAATEAADILRAHRVTPATLPSAPQEMPLSDALAAVERGEYDAVVITAAAPAPELQNFAAAHSVRFLPLDGDAIALMTAGTSSYLPITVPAGTYPGQSKPIATVAVTAQLVSLVTTPAGEIQTLLQVLLGEVDYLGHGSGLGTLVSLRSARSGLTLPLHPGAEAFFAAAIAAKPAPDSARPPAPSPAP